MVITINVPLFVTQLVIGGTGRDDSTGCWYPCVCMVGYFFQAGPTKIYPTFLIYPLRRME